MAGAGLTLKLEGADEMVAVLEAAASRLDHPEPMFDEIGGMLIVSTQQRFETEHDPAGNPWPPSIRARLTGGKTLTDSAALRNSISKEPSDAGVAVGSNVIYAAIEQFGGTIKPVRAKHLVFNLGGETVFADQVKIPARPYLGLDADDEKAIIDIAGEYVFGGVDAG